MSFKEFFNLVKKHKLLVICVVVFIFLRLPSLFEPTWYGDEGIYAAIGNGISHGSLLYKDIWDNKPPAIYYIYATIIKIFGPNQFWIRFISLLFGIVAVVFFYKLFRLLFKKRAFVPTLIFCVLFGSTIIEGNIANAENFFIPLSILGIYFGIKSLEEKRTRNLILFGLSFGFAFLFKIHPIFEFVPTLIYIFLKSNGIKNWKNFLNINIYITHYLLVPILFFILPLVLYILIAFAQGNLIDFLNMTFSQSQNYVKYSPNNNIGYIFLQDSLLIRSLLLIICLILSVYFYIKTQSKRVFIVLLFIFASYACLFSGRPYGHYLLQLILSSIFLGYLFYEIYKNSKNSLSKLNLILYYFFIIAFVLQLFFQGNVRYSYIDTKTYFSNFAKNKIGITSNQEYYSSFDSSVNKLNDLISSTSFLKDKSVFLLDDLPWYYALAQTHDAVKYVTLYHLEQDKVNINNFAEELGRKAEYIIVNKDIYDKYELPIKNLITSFYTPLCSGRNGFVIYRHNKA